MLGFLVHAFLPAFDIGAGERLGLEGPIARRRGERAVQLRGARGEGLDEHQVRGMVRFRAAALGLQISLQVVERVAPAVALVWHEGLQQRQGRRFTEGFSASRRILHRSGDRHAVGEFRHLGEEAPDLELGIHARPQPPVALQKQALAQRHRGIGRLRLQPAHRQRGEIAARDLAESIGRSKADGAALGRQAAVLADRLDHIAAEALVGHGVADHADVRLLANARHRRLGQASDMLLVLFPGERERQEVARVTDPEECEEPAHATARVPN